MNVNLRINSLCKLCRTCLIGPKVSRRSASGGNPPPWEHFEQKYKKSSDEAYQKKHLLKIWGGVSTFAVAAGVILYIVEKSRQRVERKTITQRNVSIGKPAIGGPFELRTLDDKKVTNEDFKGKWVLIYFGFTNCPDICPEELEKMSQVHVELKKKGYPSIPVFVSVDPERDTPEKIARYLEEFHPDFVGLTGTMEEVTKVVKTFKVYFMKGPKDEDGDYVVDHSIICYLLNPAGDFVEYFGQNKTAADMLDMIKKHISFGNAVAA